MADDQIDEVVTEVKQMTVEDVAARHRRERKELQAKIMEIKKNAPKTDKKKRKEALEEVSRIEHELEHRQEMELQSIRAKEEKSDSDDVVEVPVTLEEHRISRAQRRRDKKLREERIREEGIRSAGENTQNGPKVVETRKLFEKLMERQLASYQIPSDGDCLYNAIRHQLDQSDRGVYTVKQLRKETANYIRANKSSYICFMTHPSTGRMLNDAEFEEYCESICSRAAWGGQIELMALSSIVKAPIEVLQAEGPPMVHGDDELDGPNLVITYHRHLYRLGEHYNSTQPLSDVPADKADEVQPNN